MPGAPTREKIRDATRSRRAILDAGEQLFARRGYEAATMGDIGAAAGLSRGAPAYFFGTKEDLYRAVLARAFTETAELVQAVDLDADGFEEAATKTIGRYLDFLSARPSFLELVVRECLEGGRFLHGLPEHLAAVAAAMQVVEQGQVSLRAELDPRHLLLSGISLCWFPLIARPLTAGLGFDPQSPVFVEQRKKQVVELLLHGALSRS
jgi:TetR/AcrR family transcriptional regulator